MGSDHCPVEITVKNNADIDDPKYKPKMATGSLFWVSKLFNSTNNKKEK